MTERGGAKHIIDQIRELLDSLSIKDFDVSVLYMLVELYFGKVSEILEKAKTISSKRKVDNDLTDDDIKLAINLSKNKHLMFDFGSEAVIKLAQIINNQNLPPLPEGEPISLPSRDE